MILLSHGGAPADLVSSTVFRREFTPVDDIAPGVVEGLYHQRRTCKPPGSVPFVPQRWDSAVSHPAPTMAPMTEEHKVYVVDQDSSARQGLVRLLGKAGYDVVSCDSMEAYLAMFEGDLTGCLVLDATTMGPMDPITLKAFHDRFDLEAVIVIAADDDPESRKRARAIKAKAFFRKPVDGPALLDAISWSVR